MKKIFKLPFELLNDDFVANCVTDGNSISGTFRKCFVKDLDYAEIELDSLDYLFGRRKLQS